MEISSPTCAPFTNTHTHVLFISAPNWAHTHPSFPRFLYTLVTPFLGGCVQLVSGHLIGQHFYAFKVMHMKNDEITRCLFYCQAYVVRLFHYIHTSQLEGIFLFCFPFFYYCFYFLPFFFLFSFCCYFFRLRSLLHSLGLLSVACSTLNYSRGLVVAAGDGGGGGGPFSGSEFFFLSFPFCIPLSLSLSTKSHTKKLSGRRRRRRRRRRKELEDG